MIISVVGKKGSGKDVVGDYFAHYHGFIRYKFAGPIKASLKEIFLWTDEHTEGSLKEVVDPLWGISPREAMQLFGTELFQYELGKYCENFQKVIGRNIWALRAKLFCEKNANKDVIITDMRFPHEAEIMRSLPNNHILKIDRPNIKSDDSHASEMEMENITSDIVIHNDLTIESFYNKLTQWYKTQGDQNA